MTLAEKLEYVSLDDKAKLFYGRILWKTERGRQLLLNHWLHPEHHHRERFIKFRPIIERILNADAKDDEILEVELEKDGWSLRSAMREIPSIAGKIPFRTP